MDELFRALPALLKQFDDNEDLREAVVFAAWRKIAGESLGRHTVPIRLFKNHLIIAVSGETWKKHLEKLAGQMIFRINSVLERAEVNFIEFRVDRKSIEKAARRPTGRPTDDEVIEAATAELDDAMLRSAESIRDENLRYQFLLAAGSCLARKRRRGNEPD